MQEAQARGGPAEGVPIAGNAVSALGSTVRFLFQVARNLFWSCASLASADPIRLMQRHSAEVSPAWAVTDIGVVSIAVVALVSGNLADLQGVSDTALALTSSSSTSLQLLVCLLVIGAAWSVGFGFVLAKLLGRTFSHGLRRASTVFLAFICLLIVLQLWALLWNREPSTSTPMTRASIFLIVGIPAAVGMIRSSRKTPQLPKRFAGTVVGLLLLGAPEGMFRAIDGAYLTISSAIPSLQASQYRGLFNERPNFIGTGGLCVLAPDDAPELRCTLTAALLSRRDVIVSPYRYSVVLREPAETYNLFEKLLRTTDTDVQEEDERSEPAVLTLPGDKTIAAVVIKAKDEFPVEVRIKPPACKNLVSVLREYGREDTYLQVTIQLLSGHAGAGVFPTERNFPAELPYGRVAGGEPADFVVLGNWSVPNRLIRKFVERCQAQGKPAS